MDKAFEQINYLKTAIALKNIEFENKNKEKTILEQEKDKLNFEKKRLVRSKGSYQMRISYYLYIQDNIKEIKMHAIISTIILILISQLIIFGANSLMFDSLKLLPILIPNLICIPTIFLYGGCGKYYKNKKFLKKVNILDLENEINAKDEEINVINKKIDLNQKELDKVLENMDNITDVINKLEEEVRTATELRNNVINNYIENNKEFETLLNSEFEDNFDQKTKTFKKKKQESK